MGKRLNRIRSSSILGFTVQDMAILFAVFSVIGILLYFWFMEQQEPINDSKTYRTVGNAITVVDVWVSEQEDKATPVPPIDSLDVFGESDVELELTGTANGYCIIGKHDNGNISKKNGYVYASIDGIINSDGTECVNGKFSKAEEEATE